MENNNIIIKQADKYKTVVYPYRTDSDECKGSVVVLHGMAEHHLRYEKFAHFLCDNGYDVFMYDHRGHGTDKKHEELGFFAEKNGYKKVIGDAIHVLRYVSKNNRGEKLILFGHSMGSIIARCVIQYFDGIDCAVISGTSYMKPAILKGGSVVASLVKFFKGPRHISPFLNNLTLGGKDFSRLCKRTSVDWLTRDNTVVGKYLNDPYCGFVCTTSFYKDLLKLAQHAGTPKFMTRTRKNLPIFLIAGSQDPVGGCGRDVSRLFQNMQKLGFTGVECTIYEDCRHELLNELNQDEIMADILSWIEKHKMNKKSAEQIHDDDIVTVTDDTPEQDEEEVLAEIRKSYDSIIHPEETEGEKKLAEIRAKKQAKKQL